MTWIGVTGIFTVFLITHPILLRANINEHSSLSKAAVGSRRRKRYLQAKSDPSVNLPLKAQKD